MVLTRGRSLALLTCLAAPCAAQAQQIDTTAPVLDLPQPGMDAQGLPAGPFQLYPSAEVRVGYDSNIYAEPDDPVDDGTVTFTPRLEARLKQDAASLSLTGEASLRRYFNRSSENSNAGYVDLRGSYAPSESDRITSRTGWRRAIEDRGDPEARDTRSTGPRQINILDTELGWNHDGRRTHFSVRGSAARFDYRAPIDSDRDLNNYAVRASFGYDVAANLSAVITGFYTRRDYWRPVDFSGVNRDADTYGARAGVRLADTGLLRGEATVGVFRFSPDDPTLRSRTGVSAEASLTYLPSRRIAFTLDAFNGDVATVRNGAQSRTDTRIRFGIQAEARKDLRFQASAYYRHSDFVGTDISERTIGVTGEAEYRINRYLSLAVTANYADRQSDDPTQPFERTRVGIELRSRF